MVDSSTTRALPRSSSMSSRNSHPLQSVRLTSATTGSDAASPTTLGHFRGFIDLAGWDFSAFAAFAKREGGDWCARVDQRRPTQEAPRSPAGQATPAQKVSRPIGHVNDACVMSHAPLPRGWTS